MYKGMNVLYWPSIINYQLLPPHSVLYWPSTQLHHLVKHSWANWIELFIISVLLCTSVFEKEKNTFFVNSKVYFQCSIILKAVKQIKATKGYWLVMLEHSSSQRIQRKTQILTPKNFFSWFIANTILLILVLKLK